MRRLVQFVLFVSALPVVLAAQSSPVHTAVASITEHDYRQRIGVIAHDSMQGRDTPSRGLNLTAEWVAAEFSRFGLSPAGDDGGFIQRYPIRRVRLDLDQSSVVLNGTALRFGQDVARLFGGRRASVTGPLVIISGSGGARELRGAELAGAVVAVVAPTDRNGRISGDGERFVRAVFSRRPAAILVVADVADSVWARYQEGQLRDGFVVGDAEDSGPLPILVVRDRSARPALADAGVDLAAARRAANRPLEIRPAHGASASVTLRPQTIDETAAPNTVGLLEGSDPTLKDEYIVFSAHMDHVGVSADGRCRARGADSICNGADDDASGTVGVVELAEAFAMLDPRPRRSILFLTVSGEERGLWGSEYFAAHPPVPVGQIVADLNADMIGRNWSDTIVVIGKEHSDLGRTLHQVTEAHPELHMAPIDDLWPRERFYFRSDHYNFARRGVPVLFFFNGTHDDYHQPTDHPDKIDAEKASRIVKLMFYLGLEIANRDARPQWDPESYRQVVTDGQ